VATQLNIGCGDAPTAGWINYDNSPAVWLARRPVVTWLLLLGRPRSWLDV